MWNERPGCDLPLSSGVNSLPSFRPPGGLLFIACAAWLFAALRGSAPAADPAAPNPNPAALRLAIEDLLATHGPAYPRGTEFLARLAELEAASHDPAKSGVAAAALGILRHEAMLAHPLLDFGELLAIRRDARRLGLPANWQGNSCLPPHGYDNALLAIDLRRPDQPPRLLAQPTGGRFIGDVDLDFDASRIIFSAPDESNRWQIWEMPAGGGDARPLPLVDSPLADNFDACYLPGGDLIFSSTAPAQGVPCVRGGSAVANLYRWHRSDGTIRRLTFDQDHSWCPTVTNDGRVMFLRWEYSDLPHFASRILFQMNPDGTNQRELYGSNSYWPNSLFYARPIPADPSQFVAIVGGHHGVPRMGEMVLFDPRRGRHEAAGAVQRIPGRGHPVEPLIRDHLVDDSWPRFLHPWPLDGKYFLVSAQPAPDRPWGIYLADVFDNLTLLREEPGQAWLEPQPLQTRPQPPLIPPRTRAGESSATLQIADIYAGPGLAGLPRGTIKSLRLFTYHFAYTGMGGQIDRVGLDGPWDIKRVLGTVPVEPDGSAHFEVPANTPLSIQPLDSQGRAVQLMRSWTTAMPGEVQSCVGCHESQNNALPPAAGLAAANAPSPITPFFGPTRGFSFEREVQPVLDRHCSGCHDGRAAGSARSLPDFTRRPPVSAGSASPSYNDPARFPPAYLELRRFVRGHTMESDMRLLRPYEFHASTTRLVQLLENGHHGVALDRGDWDRIITWIDLNTPCHGTWTEICGPQRVAGPAARRRAAAARYDGITADPEAILPVVPATPMAKVEPLPVAQPAPGVEIALTTPATTEPAAIRHLDLGGGRTLELVLVRETGALRGGGRPDRTVTAPFWIARREITNAQFARFNPHHDSGLEHGDFLQFSEAERGFPLNHPDQPVCRVSWLEARRFCVWLASLSGEAIGLPTAAEWEWALRTGGSDPAHPPAGNFADPSFRAVATLGWGLPSGAIPPWRPAAGPDDGFRVAAPVGSFAADSRGIHDLLGNAAEWVADPGPDGRRLALGASWSDLATHATTATAYQPWQPVYNVGFRIVARPPPASSPPAK
jgi:hypothetical protein